MTFSCRFINKQLVRLQETPEAIPEGETPHTVTVCMFDTLVDFARPGDRVEVHPGAPLHRLPGSECPCVENPS